MELLHEVLWEASLEPNKLQTLCPLYKFVFFLYAIEVAHTIIFINC